MSSCVESCTAQPGGANEVFMGGEAAALQHVRDSEVTRVTETRVTVLSIWFHVLKRFESFVFRLTFTGQGCESSLICSQEVEQTLC